MIRRLNETLAVRFDGDILVELFKNAFRNRDVLFSNVAENVDFVFLFPNSSASASRFSWELFCKGLYYKYHFIFEIQLCLDH